MGRKKRDRKSSSSESEAESPKAASPPSEADEEPSPKHRRKPADREDRGKARDSNEDRRMERSRWESPDGRKRRHSPSNNDNQQRRRGHRDQNDSRTKWERNDRDRHKSKDENVRQIKNERRDSPGRETHRNHREDRRQDRRSPRRDDRSNRGRNERGRRGGRGNRFGDGPRSRFDGSRTKSEPSPEWGRAEAKDDNKPVEKEKPNFEPSGKLTEDANTVNGVVIKYTEPLESRKPKRRWRLYPFKGEKALPTLYVHRQSAFLLGRDRKVADIPLDHPSCSKQHAALQFRLVPFEREDGGEGKRVRPYLIDLESANGTFVNDVKLEPKRYHELLERDVLKFGFSSREYVILHEQSKDDALDDDVASPPATQVKISPIFSISMC